MMGSTADGRARDRDENKAAAKNRAPVGSGRSAAEGGRRIRTMRGLCHRCYRSNVVTTLDCFPRDDAYGAKPVCMDCVAHVHDMRSAARRSPVGKAGQSAPRYVSLHPR